MGLFGNKGKKIVITGTVCQICGKKLEFSRLNNHKIRLHKT